MLGLLVGEEVVGECVGLVEGRGVGGVGIGVTHAPLSQLHAALSQAGSQTLFFRSNINGEQPGAQSKACLKLCPANPAQGINLTYEPASCLSLSVVPVYSWLNADEQNVVP